MDRSFSDPGTFYDEYAAAEWDRLAGGIDGRLEFECTTDALAADLPGSGRVGDVGGGAGRYAVWLAERGYDVALTDLSRGQLSVAREKVAEFGVDGSVSLSQGSVTDLPFPDGAFDATLCLGGALSHVLDPGDRRRAAGELARVTAPGGPVFVSVMGLLGAVQLYLLTGHHLRALPELLKTGDHDAELLERHGYEGSFTETHYFRRAELVSLLSEGGLEVERVAGLEGLASPLHDDAFRERLDGLDDAEREAVFETVRATNDAPAVADLSVHVLAVGRAQ